MRFRCRSLGTGPPPGRSVAREATGPQSRRGVAPGPDALASDIADCSTVISENWIYLGSAIGALGALVYLRDTLRGTTKPNRVTWLLWAVAPLLAAAVQFQDGVGLRSLPTFMVGFMPLLIFVASFHNTSSVWRVRRVDYACGAFSVLGTVVWLVTRNGILA